jgi:hypothetical protein
LILQLPDLTGCLSDEVQASAVRISNQGVELKIE